LVQVVVPLGVVDLGCVALRCSLRAQLGADRQSRSRIGRRTLPVWAHYWQAEAASPLSFEVRGADEVQPPNAH